MSTFPSMFLRLFLPLALLLAGAMGFYGSQIMKRELSLLHKQEAVNARLGAGALSGKIEFLAHDLMFLSHHSALRTAVERPSPENIAHLAEDAITFSESRGHYDQIRWIDENGLEMVRVDYLQGKSVAVPAGKLQDKSHRYYFTDAIGLNPGEMYLSPLDLNIEQGRIETPYKPMLRAATPIANLQGKKRGIVILNYYGNDMLQAFVNNVGGASSHGMVVNGEGYWLKSHEAADEWGFMFKRPDLSLAVRAPAAWERIRNADHGQVELDDGLWTWETVYPLQAGQNASLGAVNDFAPGRGELEQRQYFWKTVMHYPAADLNSIRQTIWVKAGGITALLLCIAGVGSWLLARSWGQLASTRMKYRTVADFAYDWETWIDTEGRYIYCSPSCSRITGRNSDEFFSNPRLLAEITHPDDRASTAVHFQQGDASGEPAELTFRIVMPDGQVRWLEHVCQPVLGEMGEVLGRRASNRDVTSRIQVEEALHASEKHYRSLFENMLNGFAYCRMIFEGDQPQDFIYLSVNDVFSKLTGLENVVGKRVSEVVPGIRQSDAGLFEIYGRVSLSGKPERFEIYVEALRQWFWISVYSPEKGYFVAIFDLITERKEYEEELKRSNADLEQFSYAVSHDMRQPLRMISSYLQLLERSLANQLDGEKRDYFNFAIEGAKRIDQMLVALLEYSRVGRKGEPPTWIESSALLDEALQFLRPAITEAQAKVNIAGEWPRIFASHDEILRLIQNLVGNAAKYHIAGRAPEITVTGEVIKNEWRLCVADNGVGIIPDQIKRLFKVFQRLQSREAYEGTGVGLALCRKIAEHHKGRIWAESAGEGKGSQFYVVLPVLRGGGGI